MGEASFTIECRGDTIVMRIDDGVVAKAIVEEDLYDLLFDDIKARIEQAGRQIASSPPRLRWPRSR